MADSTVIDYSKMKVIELRKELKSRGLSIVGDKSELVARMLEATTNAEPQEQEHGDFTLDSDEIDSDGVLEDEDEDKHENILEDALPDDSFNEDLALIEQPADGSQAPSTKPQKSFKRKLALAETKNAQSETKGASTAVAKKIVLNRAVSLSSVTPKTLDSETETSSKAEVEPKKIKISADSDDSDKLGLRAKRFGVLSDLEKKEARKIRFGDASNESATTNTSAISSSVPSNVDKMKKRAERFGLSVSKVMTDIENKERLEKRRAKFELVK